MTEQASEPLRIVLGSSLLERDEAIARLITSGRGSLAFILGDEACRYRLLARSINWDRILLAYRDSSALGYASFKHHRRGPFSPGLEPFRREFGWLQGAWRYGLFSIAECREWYYGFYLHGLRVVKPARQQGIATALLAETFTQARQAGYEKVELEVQLKNHSAQRLYLQQGFIRVRTTPVNWLARLLPFPAVINMRRALTPRP